MRCLMVRLKSSFTEVDSSNLTIKKLLFRTLETRENSQKRSLLKVVRQYT